MSLVNCTRWKLQSRARARAWPSVVFPTPGTPSINKCPRAKIQTRASLRTSSLPRITLRSEDSNCAARVEAAAAVSGDIELRFYYADRYRRPRQRGYGGHENIAANSSQVLLIRNLPNGCGLLPCQNRTTEKVS